MARHERMASETKRVLKAAQLELSPATRNV